MVRNKTILAGVCVVAAVCVGLAAHADTLQVTLQTAKARYLVGEPVVAVVTFAGASTLYLEKNLWDPSQHLRIMIDRGHGYVPFREKRLTGEDERPGPQPVPRRVSREFVLGYDANAGDWVLGAPGSVSLMAEYQDDAAVLVRSAPVRVAVDEPSGSERTVLDAIRLYGPEFLSWMDEALALPDHTLADAYPRSVYLQCGRLRDLQARVRQVTSVPDPSDPRSRPPEDWETRERVLAERKAAFVPEAEALASDLAGGQFEPDALLLLAGLSALAGDGARAHTIYERIVSDFPDRAAARYARERLEDEEEPIDLSVVPTPATLWPPNRKLIPVSVTVEVQGGRSADVALVSITCDDGCDVARDVVGADLNTDDRQFQLRAERSGGNKSGRTYTITYSATAGGATATAQTTVVVPHDQRP